MARERKPPAGAGAEPEEITEAVFIDAPRDRELQAFVAYWQSLHRGDALPSRADFDPVKVPKLLPNIILYNVEKPGGPYTIRLVGEEVQQFVGQNATGRRAGAIMNTRAAAMMNRILDAVSIERTPRYRAGKTHWLDAKNFREFEACFLPLAADGKTVNMILCAVKFPETAR